MTWLWNSMRASWRLPFSLDDITAVRLDGGLGIQPLDRSRRDPRFARPERVADGADYADARSRRAPRRVRFCQLATYGYVLQPRMTTMQTQIQHRPQIRRSQHDLLASSLTLDAIARILHIDRARALKNLADRLEARRRLGGSGSHRANDLRGPPLDAARRHADRMELVP